MTNKEEILRFLKERKSEFFSDYQLIKLGLFSSFARGEETEASDIGLIVEFEPNTEKKSGIKTLVEKQFNRDVDICRA